MSHRNPSRIHSNPETLIVSMLLLACTMFAATAAFAWSPTGDMTTPRTYHAAVRLLDGRVLVAGGNTALVGGNQLSSAEIYDPATGLWTATGSMAAARDVFSLTLLPNGKVLV